MSVTVQLGVHETSDAVSKVMEALEAVAALQNLCEVDSDTDSVVLPEWLARSFADERSPGEDEQWLSEWRAAASATRLEMENRRGWERGEWLHRFTAENEFWSIAAVRHDSLGNTVVELVAADDVVPLAALEWLGSLAGAEVSPR